MSVQHGSQMEKFQEKNNIWWVFYLVYKKDLKITQNSLSESVEVTVDEFLTLTEKTTLLLGQASLSITYARRLNILRLLLKDIRKAKI